MGEPAGAAGIVAAEGPNLCVAYLSATRAWCLRDHSDPKLMFALFISMAVPD
jgi:hypothetical protein